MTRRLHQIYPVNVPVPSDAVPIFVAPNLLTVVSCDESVDDLACCFASVIVGESAFAANQASVACHLLRYDWSTGRDSGRNNLF